jgi:hypothetical protein
MRRRDGFSRELRRLSRRDIGRASLRQGCAAPLSERFLSGAEIIIKAKDRPRSGTASLLSTAKAFADTRR